MGVGLDAVDVAVTVEVTGGCLTGIGGVAVVVVVAVTVVVTVEGVGTVIAIVRVEVISGTKFVVLAIFFTLLFSSTHI